MYYKLVQEIKTQHLWLNTIQKYANICKTDISDMLTSHKRLLRHKYREYAAKASEFEYCDRFAYADDDGGSVEYRKVEFDSREKCADACTQYYYDNQIYSLYDCTGQRFVSSIRFAHLRDNLYLVRIEWRLDV